MTIIGSASIQIRADDKYFEPDVRKAVRKIKNVEIQLRVDGDISKASKKIRDLRYRITSNDAVLKVDANVAKAEEKLAKLLSKFLNKDLNFNAVANTQGANTALRDLSERYKNHRIPLTAKADTADARAALRHAARSRGATIYARIDPATLAAVSGLFNTLTGTLPMEKIKSAITGVAANFEGLATKSGFLTAALGALSAAILTTGANLLSIGKDITQVVGITALLPIALLGLVTVLKTNKMAWQDFGTAAADNSAKANEALAKLPPEAQEAAKALRGVREEIQKPVQKAFWEAAGTSLQDMVRTQLPSVIRGLSGISSAMGGFSKEVFDTVKGIGDLNDTFDNIGTSIRNMVPGIAPAIVALNTFAGVGSQYLPRFGEWMTELGVRFGEFTRKAQESGQINDWIETGVQRLQEMGSVVKSTIQILDGLAIAAKMSGAPGLTEMAAGLQNVAGIVNSEPFTSRLVSVFRGARDGIEYFNEGLKNLTSFMGDSSISIGIFLQKTGEISGNVLDSVRALFDGTGLGAGIFAALDGLNTALVDLQPGFANLGQTFGDLGEIAGELFRNMAPGLNQLFSTLAGVVAELKDGIIAAMPVFNEFIQALLGLVQGPIIALADMLGDVLTGFSNLPGGIQQAIMAIGLFLLLKNKFVGFFSGIGKSLADEKTGMGRNFALMRASATQITGGIGDGFATMGAGIRNVMVETAEASSRAFSPMIGRAQDIAERTRNAFSTIGAGLRAGMNISGEFNTVSTGFRNLSDNISQRVSALGTTFRNVGSDIGRFLVPAGGAVDRLGTHIGDAASRFHGHFAPARAAFAALGPAAVEAGKSVGTGLGTGLRMAGGGLVNAMGGVWGLALMAVMAVVAELAVQDQKVKGQVDSLAAAFENSGGRVDAAARKIIATNLDVKDSFFGLEASASGLDLAEKLGVPLEDVVDAAAGVPGAFQKVQESLDRSGNSASTFGQLLTPLTKMLEGTPFASLAKLGDFFGWGATEGDRLNEIIAEQTRVTDLARIKHEQIAKATNTSTVEAAALASNMGVLSDATSSASSKFDALKSNLNILNDQFRVSRDAARDHSENVLTLGDSIAGIAGKYGQLIVDTKKVDAAFNESILTDEGAFSTASLGAIEFSREMDKMGDSILKLGSSELDRVLKETGNLPQAQAAALTVMKASTEELRTSLLNAGIDAGVVDGILKNLHLDEGQLDAAINVDMGTSEADIARLALSMNALSNNNYTMALTALTEDAKNQILGVTGYAEAYSEGGWDAVIGLIDEAGPGIQEFLLKIHEAQGDPSKIKAVLDAEYAGKSEVDAAIAGKDAWNKTPTEMAEIMAMDLTGPVITEVLAKGAAMDQTTFTSKLDSSKENFDAAFALAYEEGRLFNGQIFQSKMDADNAFFEAKKMVSIASGGDFERTTFTAPLDANSAPFENAKNLATGSGNGFAGLNFKTSLDGNTAPFEGAKGAAIGSGNGFAGLNFKTSLDANGNPFQLGVRTASDTGQVFSGKDFRATVSVNDNANGPLGGVLDKLGAIGGMVVTAGVNIMQSVFGGGSADGSMHDGQRWNPKFMPEFKMYANGGMENHVAQIAPPSSILRVWAEPETGGEAYIPLSKAKRKRSLEILRQVMEEFGLKEFIQFNQGGIMKNAVTAPTRGTTFNGFKSSSEIVSTTVRQGASPTVITNVYPSQGLDEEQIAGSVTENIYWRLSTTI